MMVGIIAAAALAVSSQITEVTVYSDRAQVTRTAEVELKQGMNEISFENLPQAVDSRGIQVEGSGAAMVLDVRFKTENFTEVPEATWKKLFDKRDELEKAEAAIRQKIERFNEAKSFLKDVSKKVTHTPQTEEGGAKLDPGSWESMLALYMAKSEEYDEGRRMALQDLEVIQKALKKVNADVSDVGADSNKQRRIVEVDLEAAKAGKAVLKLSYIVQGPSWTPTYDIRVDTESREMEVKYFGLVGQNTGEDWNDVSLKLSTANPGLGGRHPELQPWRISMAHPQSKGLGAKSGGVFKHYSVGYNAYEVSAENTFDDALLGEPLIAAMEMEPMEAPVAAAKQQGASVVFEVKGESEIASDNVEHRVAVTTVKLPSAFRYSAIPKLNPYAYLKAKAKNSGAHPFLEGKANVYVDGSFMTSTEMEMVSPDEEFWVFLGADESVKVEHKLIKKYRSKEGLRGKSIRHTYEYLTTVKNTHGVAEEVIVWDQLPISGSEGLKVKLLEPKYSKDTDSLKMDDEKRISWFRKLDAGEEWLVPYRFHVEAPKGMAVSGLE